jgi:FtsH-binding integral membrane protein
MSNYDPNPAAPGTFTDRATTFDAGLRAYMLRVYNYMAAGVGLTGLVALLTYQFTGDALLQSPLIWVFMLAPLALVFFISSRITRCRRKRRDCYSLSMRRRLDCRFRLSSTSIPAPRSRVFFISAAPSFLSIWGATAGATCQGFDVSGQCDRHCDAHRSIFRVGGLDWMVSIISVSVFAGLTATTPADQGDV